MKLPNFLKARPPVPATAKAQEILTRRAKLQAGIIEGVAGMAPLIAVRERAEADLAACEVDVTLGSGTAAAVESARERVDEAMLAIAHAGRRLAQIREAAISLGSDLAKVRETLKGQLPEYERHLVAELESEWVDIATKYAELRGRRASIERALNTKLALAEPQPVSISLEEIEGPHGIMRAVIDAVEAIASLGRRRIPMGAGQIPVTDGVYVMRKSLNGLQVGDRLTRWTFGDSELREMIHLDVAVPASSATQQKGVLDAMREQDRMVEEHKATILRDEHRRVAEYHREQAVLQRKTLQMRYPGWTEEAIKKELIRMGKERETQSLNYISPAPQNLTEILTMDKK